MPKIKLILDVGVTHIKLSYFFQNKWFTEVFNTHPIDTSKIIKHIKTIAKKFEIEKVFIGSIVEYATQKLEYMLKKENIAFQTLTSKDFKNQLPLNPDLDVDKIGIDILAAAYYIKERDNSLYLNFGNATVGAHYTNRLEGAIIGYDFIKSINDFCKAFNFDNTITNHFKFGIDTTTAITGFHDYVINGMILKIIADFKKIKNIYVDGIQKEVFERVRLTEKYNIFRIDDIVTKGYYKLIILL